MTAPNKHNGTPCATASTASRRRLGQCGKRCERRRESRPDWLPESALERFLARGTTNRGGREIELGCTPDSQK